jgi:hypothetical protein
MHRYAYHGWSQFLPLTYPDRAPQLRVSKLLGEDHAYLEGMRLPSIGVLGGELDYWRIYDVGVFCSISSYREDCNLAKGVFRQPCLTPLQILIKTHSVLAHARFVGQETPGLMQIIFRMDWRGLAGRTLRTDEDREIRPIKVADDRFMKTMIVPWSELRDDYFAALKRVSLPFFELFAVAGQLDPDRWLTRELVEKELAKVGSAMRLI